MKLLLILTFLILGRRSIGFPARDDHREPMVESDSETSRKVLGSSVVTSVSVILDTGNGSQSAYFSDAVGKPVSKPQAATQVASPINLLNPDRYEFYTFDDNGDLIKRLMTMDEIQTIIANGDNNSNSNESSQDDGDEKKPEKNVDEIVTNVQNVLKEEMQQLRPTDDTKKPVVFDTPDVSSTWNMILPAIFANSGEDIRPIVRPNAAMTPDTITIDDSTSKKPEEAQVTSKVPEESQETNKMPEESQDASKKPEESQVINKRPEESQATSQKPEELQMVNEAPEEFKTPNPKPEVISKKPEELPTTSNTPAQAEHTSTKPDELQMISKKPEEVTSEKSVELQVISKRPEESQMTNEKPEESQATSERSAELHVTKKKPEQSQVTSKKPEELQMTSKRPEELQVTSKKPEELQVTSKKPAVSEVTSKRPEELQVTSKKPEELQVISKKPEEMQVTSERSTEKVSHSTTTEHLSIAIDAEESKLNLEETKEIPTAKPIIEKPTTKVPAEEIASTSAHYSQLNDSRAPVAEEQAETSESKNEEITTQQHEITTEEFIPPSTIKNNNFVHDDIESESTTIAVIESDSTTIKAEEQTLKLVTNQSPSKTNINEDDLLTTTMKLNDDDPFKATTEAIEINEQKAEIEEILNQLLLTTTNIYEINTELSKMKEESQTAATTMMDDLDKPEEGANQTESSSQTTMDNEETLAKNATGIVRPAEEAAQTVEHDDVTGEIQKVDGHNEQQEKENANESNKPTEATDEEKYEILQAVEKSNVPLGTKTVESSSEKLITKTTEKLDTLPRPEDQITEKNKVETSSETNSLIEENHKQTTEALPVTQRETVTTESINDIISTTFIAIEESNDQTTNILSNIEELITNSSDQPIEDIVDAASNSAKVETVLENSQAKPMNVVNEETATVASQLLDKMGNESLEDAFNSLLSQVSNESEATTIEGFAIEASTAKKPIEEGEIKPKPTIAYKYETINESITKEEINKTAVKNESETVTESLDVNKATSKPNLEQNIDGLKVAGDSATVSNSTANDGNSKKAEAGDETNASSSIANRKPAEEAAAMNDSNFDADEIGDSTTLHASHDHNDESKPSWTLVSTVSPQTAKPFTTTQRPIVQPSKPVTLSPSSSGYGLEETTSNLDADVYRFVALCNELAFGFWRSVTNGFDTARSLIVSPFAANSLLAMVFLGARGATSGEMNEILRLDDMVTFNPHMIFKNVSESVEDLGKSDGVAVSSIVRQLYSDRSKGKLLNFYKERAKQFYDGHVEEVGFKEIGDVVRRRTNMLVKRQTGGKLAEFVKDAPIELRPPLAGVSASIFQTDCSEASVEGRDGELYFVVSPSIRQRKLVPVPAAVWRDNFLAGYDATLDATAVAIGTKDRTVSTIYVLPGQQGIAAPGDGLARLEKRLIEAAFKTETSWSRLLRTLIPRPGLEVQMPRFAHRSIVNATNGLRRMGLKDLFDADKADLRGLNGVANELYLSDMLQINSFATCADLPLTVERHSETYPAAAKLRRHRTLEMVMDEETRDYRRAFRDPLHDPTNWSIPLAERPRQARLPDETAPRLRFDRPFLYFVRHNPTGLVLHMGRFNPRLLP